MDSQAADIIWMSLKSNDLFVRVVIERSQLIIVRASDKPILSCDKATGADRDL